MALQIDVRNGDTLIKSITSRDKILQLDTAGSYLDNNITIDVVDAGGGGIDPSDATATADKILSGYTAYVATGKVTGTVTVYDGTCAPDKPTNLNPSAAYTGSEITNGYTCPSTVTMTGNDRGTEAGTYTATYAPNTGYTWSDGTTGSVTVVLTIVASGPDYLCFTANTAGSTVTFPAPFEYSSDGTTWNTATQSAITLTNAGDKIYLRNGSVTEHESGYGFGTFVMTGSIAASGNIMSLVDNTVTTTTIPYQANFYQLFQNCTSLTRAPQLPATTLTLGAYNAMFSGCTNLVIGPTSIPAAIIEEWCCYQMFLNCSSMVNPPTIAATTVNNASCQEMFKGCTSMITVPHIGTSTFLGQGCLVSMFEGCTSLTKVNAIVTTAFPDWCCASMYKNCTQLIVAASSSSTAPYAWTMPMTGTATEGSTPFASIFEGCQTFGDTWGANITIYSNLEPV